VFNACYYFFHRPVAGAWKTRDIANVTTGCYNLAAGTEGHKVDIVAENKSRNATCSVEGKGVMRRVTGYRWWIDLNLERVCGGRG
jgi:hypothetical protein